MHQTAVGSRGNALTDEDVCSKKLKKLDWSAEEQQQQKNDLNAPFYYAPAFWGYVYKYPKYDARLWHMTDFYTSVVFHFFTQA